MAPSDSGSIKAHFPAMIAAAEDIMQCHNTLLQEHDDLLRFLNTLRSDWHGKGGESWQHAQGAWDTAADAVYMSLLQIHNALVDSHDNYAATETQLNTMWG